MHPRAFQHLSRARGPQSTRARGGDGKGVTCQALVQSWFLFRVSNSQLSFSCVSEALFFFKDFFFPLPNYEKNRDWVQKSEN